MGLSHEQVGSTIPAKINTYNCSPEQNYLFISAMRHPVSILNGLPSCRRKNNKAELLQVGIFFLIHLFA